MAFMDKLGQVANKVGEVAESTFDYSRAKGKIVLEKGKIKDLKEKLGEMVYGDVTKSGKVDMDKVNAIIAEIEEHNVEIERLREEAKQSGEDLSDIFDSKDEEK